MRKAILASSFVASSLLLITIIRYTRLENTPVSHVDVFDGFETSELSKIWDTSRFARGAVTMQSEIVRGGRGAARVIVHRHDKFEAGINGDADSERAELAEAQKLVSKENNTYEYSFSMLIPADFPVVPTRLVITQWKQDCEGHAECSDPTPGSIGSRSDKR